MVESIKLLFKVLMWFTAIIAQILSSSFLLDRYTPTNELTSSIVANFDPIDTLWAAMFSIVLQA